MNSIGAEAPSSPGCTHASTPLFHLPTYLRTDRSVSPPSPSLSSYPAIHPSNPQSPSRTKQTSRSVGKTEGEQRRRRFQCRNAAISTREERRGRASERGFKRKRHGSYGSDIFSLLHAINLSKHDIRVHHSTCKSWRGSKAQLNLFPRPCSWLIIRYSGDRERMCACSREALVLSFPAAYRRTEGRRWPPLASSD